VTVTARRSVGSGVASRSTTQARRHLVEFAAQPAHPHRATGALQCRHDLEPCQRQVELVDEVGVDLARHCGDGAVE
jgi:hypothetical protein